MAYPIPALTAAFTSTIVPFLVSVAGTDVPDYVGLGAQGIAVAGLAYTVRALLAGDLIARRSSELEKRLEDLVEESHRRETELQRLIERRAPR